MAEIRLNAARAGSHGTQVLTFEQLAVRLAGGFYQPIDSDSLRLAVRSVLATDNLGELDAIKILPGMVDAAATTLRKAWRAGLQLDAMAGEHARLASIARLEAGVMKHLPAAMLRPADIVSKALARLAHAERILGSVEIVGITELSPCWRELLVRLADYIPVVWLSGPRATPAWLAGSAIEVRRSAAERPMIEAESAANSYHEAIEALRWARALVASGQAAPQEIGIAAVGTDEYDDHFLALRSDANLDLHFVQGVRVAASRDGQAAAALADAVLRGLSATRMRRLVNLLSSNGPFAELPEGWLSLLPREAPLASPAAWLQLIDHLDAASWPDGVDHRQALRQIVDLVGSGVKAAAEAGETLLSGKALSYWRKALVVGPVDSLDLTLAQLRQDDGIDPATAVAWMSADGLAATPRRFVRLLGLNSGRWPRRTSEDRLLPDHIVPSAKLNPLPPDLADRRDYETILATTRTALVLSRSRRDGEGRLLGRSPLTSAHINEHYRPRNHAPQHAFSEADRVLARAAEFNATPLAQATEACWRDWLSPELTAHDGLVRADHPVIEEILRRDQSASSLVLLLRNPLGFTWKYGLGWREPDADAELLALDALGEGNLVHQTLDLSLRLIEAETGLARAAEADIRQAVERAIAEVALHWEAESAVPPRTIWQRTLRLATELAVRALTFSPAAISDAVSFSEVPFGGSAAKSDATTPWDPNAKVHIPGTDLSIRGYIDRLDLSGDRKVAFVRDYKTGKTPKPNIVLNGGRELQRCLYAFATRALLGADVNVTASLYYPRDEVDLPLQDADAVLSAVTGHLVAAVTSLRAGAAVPGTDAGNSYDDLALALPANAAASYYRRKAMAVGQRLGAAADVWEAQ
jgi:hypothetical protein